MAATFKHLVVLMMENRSFDHLLGFLPGVNGLKGDETNPLTPEGPLVQVSQNARTVHDLIPDPGHEFVNVNMQIFGNTAGTDDGQPKMQGFVRDYALVSNDSAQAANIMKCFTPTTVPVLSALAKGYAVSDSWYSSVPGSTIPNRLFAHGATSNGSLTQDVIAAPATLHTIFEAMDEPGNPYTYRIYTNGSSVLMANLYLIQRQSAFHSYSDFANDCAKGDLPAYTFIEPAYDDDLAAKTYATSQHPDFPVDEGEGFIADVYNALTGSPAWKDTLLLIVYDEHGGIMDHVMPPNIAPSAANAGLPDVQHSVNPAFDFRRLGVRVPAVFVSPRISTNRIINGQNFEHSSIVATVRKLFCKSQTPFNWREAQAPTFEGVLDRDDVRPDIALPVPFVSAAPSALEITAAHDAIAAGGAGLNIAAAADGHLAVIQATALPKQPPAIRKPTDLVMNMARSMQYSMSKLGIKPAKDLNQIYSAQDAVNYLNNAAQLLRRR
jgi:phospholipase C